MKYVGLQIIGMLLAISLPTYLQEKQQPEVFRTWEIEIHNFEDGMITIPIDEKNLIIEVPVKITIPDSIRYEGYFRGKRI